MSAAPSVSPASDLARRWTAMARIPGILFATAGLIIAMTGTMALDLPGTDTPAVEPQSERALADAPVPLPVSVPSVSKPVVDAPAAPAPAATADDGRLTFATGDQLSPAQMAEFHAHIAKLQSSGLHKGHAVYASW